MTKLRSLQPEKTALSRNDGKNHKAERSEKSAVAGTVTDEPNLCCKIEKRSDDVENNLNKIKIEKNGRL